MLGAKLAHMTGPLNWVLGRVDDVTDLFSVWFRRGDTIPFEQVMRELELADGLALTEPRPE